MVEYVEGYPEECTQEMLQALNDEGARERQPTWLDVTHRHHLVTAALDSISSSLAGNDVARWHLRS